MKRFPPGFLWGAATSAFQIEGATTEGGRGESIWDRFCSVPGNVSDGSDGTVACDHFHRFRDDVALMRDLGVRAYRFSVAWPRVLPHGRGAVNEAGLDFYDALVDALLAAGITPCATLYHWDLPQTLQDEGGWGARSTAEAFVGYADAVSRRLGDRVAIWATHNEPWCTATLGHERGEHAPGLRDPALALRAAHHVMLSHGWAVPALRANSRRAEVGIVLNLSPAYAASSSAADRDAARAYDGFFNRWYLDPLLRGEYPADAVLDRVRASHLPSTDLPFVQSGDMAAIATRVDYLGVNYYSRAILRSDQVPEDANAPRTVHDQRVEDRTDMGWEVFPDGLADLLVRLHREYHVPRLYVMENGAAYATAPDARGRVRDAQRIAYLRDHLLACERAIAEGVPLGGYFVWSLLDNFEWAFGYEKRFGIVWVDFETQRRIPKDSALWYRDVIAAGGVEEREANGRRQA